MNLYTAIIIDDEPYGAADLACALDLTGLFEVLKTFHSVKEAMSFLKKRKYKPNFVFCDNMMEGMRGTDAVAMLREWAEFVILFTAYKEKAVGGESHLLDSILEKPVDEEKIIDLVNKLRDPRDPHSRLHVPPYIAIKGIPDECEQSPMVKGEKDGEESKESVELRVAMDDVVFFKRAGNYVHVYVVNEEGPALLTGRCRTTIDALYEKFKHTNLFLYVNQGELVNVRHIIYDNMDFIGIRGEMLKISEKGRAHYLRYKRFIGLKP